MRNHSVSRLLRTLYDVGLYGSFLAVPGLVFLLSVIPDPNRTGTILITLAAGLAAALVILAVGSRLAMRVFYGRACTTALDAWMADTHRNEAITAVELARLADLRADDAWIARQFLERKAAEIDRRGQEADEPNRWQYRFPRSIAGSE